MKKILVASLMVCAMALPTLAGPAINSAVEQFRIFNDFPNSLLTFGNTYPADLFIQDDATGQTGNFANLHNWRFSENGFNPAQYANGDPFSVSTNLVLSGGSGESGLQVSPWWSPDVDGRLNVRNPDGEIAAFGGRLPFFSFTATYGLHYVAGTTIGLGITYNPHSLSAVDPATITYDVTYNSNNYTSGPLAFDQGNPLEGHGEWGMLTPAFVGGHLQAFNGTPGLVRAEWTNIVYTPEPASLTLLGLGFAALLRRRRR